MANVRRESSDTPINEYEHQRTATIARNKRVLESLRLPVMNTVLQRDQTRKRTKKTNHANAATRECHNLRPRLQRSSNEHIANDSNNDEEIGDFLDDNEDLLQGTEKKRKGRGITKMQSIFSRTPNMPKIKIALNEFGQPVGENSRKLSSVIGCLVRRNLPFGFDDWRLVDAEKKYKVWTEIKDLFDLDDDAFDWFMATAGRKWKDFKADLKRKFFDETLTDEELKKRNGDRVNTTDWEFLIDYWRSPDAQAATERAKKCRSKLKLNHTSGSVSHACCRHNLGQQLGRPPRRDEVFIKTHTSKSGVPLVHAALTINKLKAIVEARPELKDRTIQQGDAFAVVCGLKEPRGRVRVLGLGPTPQDIGVSGLKSYVPTRLQMEVLARKKAESEKSALEQRIMEMEQEMIEQQRQIVENISQHGSNSRHHVSPSSEEFVDEAHHIAPGDEEDNVCADNDNYDRIDDDNLLVHRHSSTQPVPPRSITTTPINDKAPRFSHDTLVGNEVILYALVRSEQPVAKGTVISTNPNTTVAGVPLGKQYCEVVITIVLKRDTLLPRPYVDVETMADAYRMAIAWPYKKLKVCNKTSQSPQPAAGSSGGGR